MRDVSPATPIRLEVGWLQKALKLGGRGFSCSMVIPRLGVSGKWGFLSMCQIFLFCPVCRELYILLACRR